MDWAACYWSGFLLDLFVPLWAPCQDGLELAGRWMISNFASYESLPGWAGGLVLRERGSARPLWQELLASLKPLIAAASGLPSSAGPRRALDQYGNQKFVNWLHRWKAGKDKSSSRFFCLCLTVCFLWGQKSSERLKQSRLLFVFRCVQYRVERVCSSHLYISAVRRVFKTFPEVVVFKPLRSLLWSKLKTCRFKHTVHT